jgi:hypothetical protein
MCLFHWLGSWVQDSTGDKKLDIPGEKKLSNQEAAEGYIDTSARIVQELNLTPEKIYNANEAGLFWHCLPKKTLAGGDEIFVDGFKLNKE